MQDVTQSNPYEILKVPMDADPAAIERAYNRLFDRYEPKAHAGDAAATQMLEDLNWAHDILSDPKQRSALDRSLGKPPSKAGRAYTASTSTKSTAPDSRPSATNKRPRAVAPQTTRSPLPWILVGVVALVLVGVIVFVIARLVNSPSVSGDVVTDRGVIVATVNGQPIYERELNRRYEVDLQQQMSDPLIANLLAQNDDASQRALEVIKEDALDKLINMEVIQQQAKKENLYPSPQTQNDLVAQAKLTDVSVGQTFEDSLREHGLTEEQYVNNVIQTSVYRVMASQHMPTTGEQEMRENDFINWICQTRNDYDVKILIKFATVGNKACASGLPSDALLTSGQIPPPDESIPDYVPTAEATVEGPMVPRVTEQP